MSGGIGNINYLNGALPAYSQMCNPFCKGGLDTYDIDLFSSMYGMPSFDGCAYAPGYYSDMLGDYSTMYYGATDPYNIGLGSLAGDSLFSGGFNGGFSGIPYDNFMGAGLYDNGQYFQSMEQYQKFYNQYNINQQKMQRNADVEIQGAMENIQEASDNLRNKIQQNEQSQIMGAYNAFVKSVKNAYGQTSSENIKGRAQAIYKQLNKEKIDEALRKNGHSSFVQGMLSTMTGGFYYRKSAEDNISEITGQPVGDGDKFMKGLGKTVGAIGFGTIVGGIAKGLSKAKVPANAAAAPKGSGKTAALAGIIAAGLSFLNSLRN